MPSRRPLVLDANVLLDKTFLKWLEGYHDRKILPAIAYAEIAFAFLKKYDSTEKLDDFFAGQISGWKGWSTGRHG